MTLKGSALLLSCALPLAALLATCALVAPAVFAGDKATVASADLPTVEVYKSPTCGCCAKWIDHLEQSGFTVNATDVRDLDGLKSQNGVPRDLQACHTAIVGGYLVEGHVPAEDVKRLLTDKPAIAGIAVPGMPIGSPGMEGPDHSRDERYQVLAFDGQGTVEVFSTHEP